MLLFLALALLLTGVVASGPIKRFAAGLLSGSWRPGAGTLGIACLVAGLFLLVRGAWVAGAALIAAGLGLLGTARARFRGWPGWRTGPARPEPADSSMSRTDAAAILGVPVDADRAAVMAAHRRLIRMAHPDAGGTPGLAAQLNRARDVLAGR